MYMVNPIHVITACFTLTLALGKGKQIKVALPKQCKRVCVSAGRRSEGGGGVGWDGNTERCF